MANMNEKQASKREESSPLLPIPSEQNSLDSDDVHAIAPTHTFV